MPLFIRFAFLVVVALCCASCQLFSRSSSSSAAPVQPASPDASGWYVASREPLTFCPKGYQVPGMKYGIVDGEYVYLADRSSRFFVPKGKDAQFYRKQALVARDASLKDQKGFIARSVESKIAMVGSALARAATWTAVLVGGTNPPRD